LGCDKKKRRRRKRMKGRRGSQLFTRAEQSGNPGKPRWRVAEFGAWMPECLEIRRAADKKIRR
jgi:hypothetical protein